MNQMFSKYWCDALSISSLTRATAGRSSTFLVTKQTVRNALLSAIGSAAKSGWIPAVVAKRDMIETPMPTSTRFCVAQKSSVECVISGVKPAARANDTRFAWQFRSRRSTVRRVPKPIGPAGASFRTGARSHCSRRSAASADRRRKERLPNRPVRPKRGVNCIGR